MTLKHLRVILAVYLISSVSVHDNMNRLRSITNLLYAALMLGTSRAYGWGHQEVLSVQDTTVAQRCHRGHRSALHQQGASRSSSDPVHTFLHSATSWHLWQHQHLPACPVKWRTSVEMQCGMVITGSLWLSRHIPAAQHLNALLGGTMLLCYRWLPGCCYLVSMVLWLVARWFLTG